MNNNKLEYLLYILTIINNLNYQDKMSYRIPEHPLVDMFKNSAVDVVLNKNCKKTSEAVTVLYEHFHNMSLAVKIDYLGINNLEHILGYINALLTSEIARNIVTTSSKNEFTRLELDGYAIGSLSETLEKFSKKLEDLPKNEAPAKVPELTFEEFPVLEPFITVCNKKKNKKKQQSKKPELVEQQPKQQSKKPELVEQQPKQPEQGEIIVMSAQIMQTTEDKIITTVPLRYEAKKLNWADAEDEDEDVTKEDESQKKAKIFEKQESEKLKSTLSMAERVQLSSVDSIDDIKNFIEAKKKQKEGNDKSPIQNITKILPKAKNSDDDIYISTTPGPECNYHDYDNEKWKTSVRFFLIDEKRLENISKMNSQNDFFAWRCDDKGYPVGWEKESNGYRWFSDRKSKFAHVELASNKWTTLEVTKDEDGNITSEKQVSVEYFIWATLPPRFRKSHVAPNKRARDFNYV